MISLIVAVTFHLKTVCDKRTLVERREGGGGDRRKENRNTHVPVSNFNVHGEQNDS